MAAACYDLNAPTRVWEVGHKLFGETPSSDDWLSTHPTHQRRAQNYAEWAAQASKVKLQWCGDCTRSPMMAQAMYARSLLNQHFATKPTAEPERRAPLTPKRELVINEMERGVSSFE